MITLPQATRNSLAATIAMLLAPMPASASGIEHLDCDVHHCRIHVTDQLSFEAAFEDVYRDQDRIEVTGDLTVYGPGMTITLGGADLVFERREDGAPVPFELYGTASVPLPNVPILSAAGATVAPRAVVGLASRATLKALLEEEDYPLPLAENPAHPDALTSELIEPAYLFIHYANAPTLDLPLSDWLQPDPAAGGENPLNFSLPGDVSMTVIVDPAEPYAFLSTQVGAVLVDALGDEVAAARRRAEAEEERAGSGRSDASDEGRRAADGERNQSGNDANRADLPVPTLNEFAFSALGGIPFKPASPWGLPRDFGAFKGHLYVDAQVPLHPTIELDGALVTYVGEDGFEQGGNGDVNVSFDLIPGVLGFSFPLGNASAGFRVIDGELMGYFSGLNSPDYSFLPDFIPVTPMNATRVAGVIDVADPSRSLIRAQGRFAYDMSAFKSLTGVDLSNLSVNDADLEISRNGVWIKGSTSSSIHPSIALGGRVDVEIFFSPSDPARSYAYLSGEMSVAGIGLQPVELRLDAGGFRVEGEFVTPISNIRMFGEIGPRGPQLEGSTSVFLSAAKLLGAVDALRADVIQAQDEVEKLEKVIERNRELVRTERSRSAARLASAQDAVRIAKSRVDILNDQIRDYERSISQYRSQIRSKYRWYKSQSSWKRAWAWARYQSYRAGKNGQIAWRYSQIGAVKTAIGAAKVALTVAEATLKGAEASIAVIPVDLDPRVAGPLAALGSARVGLKAAEALLPDLPEIPAELRAHIAMDLGMTGLGGTLSADFNGHRLTGGTLRFGKSPEACIDVPVVGSLCAPF